MYCYKCGAKVADDATFCETCGARLKTTHVATSAVVEKPLKSMRPNNLPQLRHRLCQQHQFKMTRLVPSLD